MDFVYSLTNFEKIDFYIFELSNYQWRSLVSNFAFNALDLTVFIIPIIFIILAVFFGLKTFKCKDHLSTKMRMLGIVTTTISVCFLLTATL